MPNPQLPPFNRPIDLKDYLTNPVTDQFNASYKSMVQNSGLFQMPEDMYTNHSGREISNGVEKVVPSNMKAISKSVTDSIKKHRSVRAVGHGCSYSDISMSEKGTILKSDLLDGLDNDWNPSFLRDDLNLDKEAYVSVKAGTFISNLNSHLETLGKAMTVLGGADVQTVGGVISTATHGSGYNYGAICDYVHSIVLVKEDGTVLRIERTEGITNPKLFKDTSKYGAKLVSDDTIFNAVLVSFGCMGVIYSVVLKVEPKPFKLLENRYIKTWKEIKDSLFPNSHNYKNYSHFRHFEFAINPYREKGSTTYENNVCCLTTLEETTKARISNNEKRRNFFYDLASDLNSSPEIIYGPMNANPAGIPSTLTFALKHMKDNEKENGGGYIDKSYNIFNKRMGSLVEKGTGIEVIVPINKGIEALQGLLKKIEDLSRGFDKSKNGLFLTAPIAVRFVKSSKALMSMFYHEDESKVFMVMEIPVISFRKIFNDDFLYKKDIEILLVIQRFFIENQKEYEARLHWGLSFKDDLTKSYAEQAYGKNYEQFKEVYQSINPNGGFRNAFTARLGLDLPLLNPNLSNLIAMLS